MGKVKSTVITVIVVVAIVVLVLFATVSCTVPFTNGVKRYNSFISSIPLGAELTGEAYTVLYPDGVISAEDYNLNIPDVPEGKDETDEEYLEDLSEYTDKYVRYGSVYIEKDVAETDSEIAGLKASVQDDAKVLSARLAAKGYSSYSVAVQDEFTIKVSVPTGFTYASYAGWDESSRSTATSAITTTLTLLSYGGELTLRNSGSGTRYDNSVGNYILTPITTDASSYFKSFSAYSSGGNYAVKVKLTSDGKESFADITSAVSGYDDTALLFYVGDNQLLSLTVSESIDGKSFYISVSDKSTSEDYAIILNSVANDNIISLDYSLSSTGIVSATSRLGVSSPLFMLIVVLLILIGVIAFSVARYKKLGLVNAMSVLIYALAIIIALMLLEIELTAVGVISAVLGLALFSAAQITVFEAVRSETKKGKTMTAAVKDGYKSTVAAMLDLHIIMIAVSLILALVCVGEAAACGLIFFIASVASYILIWFTRFMWYVCSSPVKDKFGFGGYKREVRDDD